MANTSSRRTVSRPGVSADGGGSNFQSPYQPPSSVPDFEGDLALLDPNAYTLISVGDYLWRVKMPRPGALKAVAAVADAKGGAQIHAINAFLQQHLHPEDFQRVLRRLLTPDDPFSSIDYMDLYRQAVTVGTARPFPQSSGSRAQRRSHGAPSARSSRSPAFLRRYMR